MGITLKSNLKGLPPMTQEQLKRARRLIRKECCFYDAEHNECIVLDEGDGRVCVQYISFSIYCRWFWEAVLPLDQILMHELQPSTKYRYCKECGVKYVPRGRTSQYCSECARDIRRKRDRERKRRSRSTNAE